jgi:hypothetical protein
MSRKKIKADNTQFILDKLESIEKRLDAIERRFNMYNVPELPRQNRSNRRTGILDPIAVAMALRLLEDVDRKSDQKEQLSDLKIRKKRNPFF